MNWLTLPGDPRIRVSILECRSTRPRHEAAWAKRFVFAPIQIDLPMAQATACIDNFPARAAEDAVHRSIGCLDDHAMAQPALAQLCGSGKARDESAAAARRPRGKTQ